VIVSLLLSRIVPEIFTVPGPLVTLKAVGMCVQIAAALQKTRY
jgi:hypothetical protein